MLLQFILASLWFAITVDGGGSLPKLGMIIADHDTCPLCALISHPGYLTFSDQEKSQRLERNPVSRFEEYITAHHHETSEDRAHEEFIFGQLINNLLKLESFTGQIDMIRNWKMNQKEAVSLYVNSKELSVLSFALENLVRQNRGSTESLLAMKLLKKSQRNFSALIHL
ncbi:hypothetical protein PSTG_00921, partial [Puccinia striiformis f. sp. tritici PST-78]